MNVISQFARNGRFSFPKGMAPIAIQAVSCIWLRSVLSVVFLCFAAPNVAVAAAMLTLEHAQKPGQTLQMDRSEILALPQVTINTSNSYFDGVAEYSGPLARDVLARFGIGDATIAILTAQNDYSVEVPIADFMTYDVVFATHVNGARLSLRDKGPLWLMYPLDDHAELDGPTTNGKLIWQIVHVEMR